jgi:hypothetical protein
MPYQPKPERDNLFMDAPMPLTTPDVLYINMGF